MLQKHRLTKYTLIVTLIGLAVNLILSRIALSLSLPLYLDCIGTIFAAMLGGYLPGIIVGFFSNVINGISDPMTLYYAIINILIACTATFIAERGWFSKLKTVVLSVLVFSFIGGCLGSVLTWLLYGFNFGSGISAPFATMLHASYNIPKFYAQFIADLLLDLADKSITVFICFMLLRFLPASLTDCLTQRQAEKKSDMHNFIIVKKSLRFKVVLLIALSALVLGCSATVIGGMLYTGTMTDHYVATAKSVSKMAAGSLDGDRINSYLSGSYSEDDYLTDKSKLTTLVQSVPDVKYIYIYRILSDGCHVVFDIDTPDTVGGKLGDIIPIEKAFFKHKAALLSGKKIPFVISNGQYGWLLTYYYPIKDSFGKTAAYAAADILMENVVTDRAVFLIKMASLLFGISILFVAFALWFSERRLVDPINLMAQAAADFAYDTESERLETTDNIQKLSIHTGDEIENLYNALKKTVTDVSTYIADINKKNEIISHMQGNIIMSFSTMVESRDNNTGHHIHHTAEYVRVIANELYREGKYPELITPQYIAKIVQSAPLHDLGKIKISDTLLNKPGKLTSEEFEIIKTHTTAGKKILLGIIGDNNALDYLSEAVNMAAYHHERWDGLGYPEGLCGDEIPLSACIMAVADVYDALVSKRSYKDSMPVDKAIAIIAAESGKHFSPDVAQAFLNVQDEIKAVANSIGGTDNA